MDLSKIRTAPLSFLPRSCHSFFFIFLPSIFSNLFFLFFFSKFIAHYPFSLDLATFFFIFLPSNLFFLSFFSKFIAHYRFLVTGHGRSSEQSIRHCATRDAVREMSFRRPFYAA